MKNDITTHLANEAMSIASQSAVQYLRNKNLCAKPDLLMAAIKDHVKASLCDALDDARAAIECNMTAAAAATFKMSMVLAGTRAAKEVGCPTREPLLVDVGEGFYREEPGME